MASASLAEPLLPSPTPASGASYQEAQQGLAAERTQAQERDARATMQGRLDTLHEHRPLETARTLTAVCPFILVNEFCERLCYYGLATNLVNYLVYVMDESPQTASVAVNVWSGTCYLTPLLGAWLADSYWGRYHTIAVFSTIYCVGVALLTASASWPNVGYPAASDGRPATWYQNAFLYGALGVVAVGTGGIKPNVSAFGADQFDPRDPRDAKDKASFFSWFYLSINVGSLISSTVIVTVQQNYSWPIGFSIPAFAMVLSLAAFVAGRRRYRHRPVIQSPLTRVAQVWYDAVWRNRNARIPDANPCNEVPPPLPASAPASAHAARKRNLVATHHLRHAKPTLWILRAERAWGGRFSLRQVGEVWSVVRLVPFFWLSVTYWAIYSQMQTLFVLQGNQLDRHIVLRFPDFLVPVFGKSSADWEIDTIIPSATMSTIDTLVIIGLLPLFDKVVYPLFARCGMPVTLLQRMGWGNVVALLSMVSAGVLEIYRRHRVHEGHTAPGGHGGAASDVTIMWQGIPLLLIGASEVLGSVGQLEFFYSESPPSMRSCCMALQLVATALGSYAASLLLVIAHWASDGTWVTKNLNHGHAENYFFALAGLMAANQLAFIWYSYSFTYTPRIDEDEPPRPMPSALSPPPASTNAGGLPHSATITIPGMGAAHASGVAESPGFLPPESLTVQADSPMLGGHVLPSEKR